MRTRLRGELENEIGRSDIFYDRTGDIFAQVFPDVRITKSSVT